MAVESSKAKQSTVVCCSVQLSAVSCFGAACQSIQICQLALSCKDCFPFKASDWMQSKSCSVASAKIPFSFHCVSYACVAKWQINFLFSKLCYYVGERPVAAYAKPQKWKKEKCEGLRGEGDKIKFIDLRFERWQVVGFRRARRRQDVP